MAGMKTIRNIHCAGWRYGLSHDHRHMEVRQQIKANSLRNLELAKQSEQIEQQMRNWSSPVQNADL